MKQCNLASIKKVYWEDVRKRFHEISPELAKLIDNISPGKDFPLYLAKYPYGKIIVEKGKYYLPASDGCGELYCCDDPRIPTQIKENFAYSNGRIPVGMVMDKSLELLRKSRNNLITWGLHETGSIFALWRELETGPIFSHPSSTVVSGARSAYLIPPVKDYEGNLRLQKFYGFNVETPATLNCQWEIFKGICQSPRVESNWYTQLLFFTNKWFEKIKGNDPAWVLVHRYLLQYAWEKTAYWRNETFYDHAFSCALDGREHLRPDGYAVDTARHLFRILAGAIPGFSVAINDNYLPASIIQKAYIDVYKLSKYIPTIMHPAYFSLEEPFKKIYYSIILPTTLEFATKRSNLKNAFHFMRELNLITRVLKTEIGNGNLELEKTKIGYNSINSEFEYFHMHKDPFTSSRQTIFLAKEDKMLTKCLVKCPNKEFDHNGNFIRACVRISCNEENK